MNKLPALGFLLLGVLYFFTATRWLSVTSETALMAGAMGLLPAGVAATAALIARARLQRSILVGVAAGFSSSVALVVFFSAIWPML